MAVKKKIKKKTKKKTKAKVKAKAKTKAKVKARAKPKSKVKTKTRTKVAKKTTKKTAKKTPATAASKSNKKGSSKKLSPRDKKIQNIRNRLVEQKEQLISDAEAALANELPGQILFPDLGDQASAEIDRNFMLRLKGREQKLLTKIEGVLEAIDLGQYGICESCGSEIEIKRLEARPVTSMCIECKTEQEEEERLRE
jgi:DnaK suppressor protein